MSREQLTCIIHPALQHQLHAVQRQFTAHRAPEWRVAQAAALCSPASACFLVLQHQHLPHMGKVSAAWHGLRTHCGAPNFQGVTSGPSCCACRIMSSGGVLCSTASFLPWWMSPPLSALWPSTSSLTRWPQRWAMHQFKAAHRGPSFAGRLVSSPLVFWPLRCTAVTAASQVVPSEMPGHQPAGIALGCNRFWRWSARSFSMGVGCDSGVPTHSDHLLRLQPVWRYREPGPAFQLTWCLLQKQLQFCLPVVCRRPSWHTTISWRPCLS